MLYGYFMNLFVKLIVFNTFRVRVVFLYDYPSSEIHMDPIFLLSYMRKIPSTSLYCIVSQRVSYHWAHTTCGQTIWRTRGKRQTFGWYDQTNDLGSEYWFGYFHHVTVTVVSLQDPF